MRDSLLVALRTAVGEAAVVTDPAMLAAHEVDWTGRFRGRARAVVRPASAVEVAAVLGACARERVAVVTQGGNTGLVAGAVPHGAVVLSTVRLAELGEVDSLAAEVTAGAGVPLERLQAHVAPFGLAPAVDLAARGSATIGGMVATDAGGIHAVRYGSMRRGVIGIEVVLADGTLARRLPGLPTPAPGTDLVTLLAGSEGTLGVITRARLRLIPAWPHRATALVAVDDVATAVEASAHLRARLADLEALELVDGPSLALAAEHAGQPAFGGGRPCLLVETAANRPTIDDLAAALEITPGLRDAALADDGPGRRRLWALRESVTEAIATLGVPHKLDVALPLASLAGFVGALGPAVAGLAPTARVLVFGHLGLGNLHVNVVGPGPDDERVDDAVLRLAVAHGGSIAGEHGIGRAKARWLHLDRSPEELAIQAAVKRALDPLGLLNPGVLEPGRSDPLGPSGADQV